MCLLLLVALATLGTACNPGASSRSGIIITNPSNARPYFHDLGKVFYGDRPSHTFELKNDDSEPVQIHDLLPSCSCSLPRLSTIGADGIETVGQPHGEGPLLTLAPGATARLFIEIDTTQVERMNLDKLAQVRLRCDSKTTPFLTFELHLLVEQSLRSVPANVDMPEIPTSAGAQARADVSSDRPGNTHRVTALRSVEGPFEVTLTASPMGAVERWIVNVRAIAGQELGPVRGKIVLDVQSSENGSSVRPFVIPITGTVVPDVVAHPPIFQVHAGPDGKARAEGMLVALVPGRPLKIRSGTIEGTEWKALTLTFEPVTPDAAGRDSQWAVKIEQSGAIEAASIQGTIQLRTDDELVPLVRIPFQGRVK